MKICGLTRTEDIDAVNESHPDFAGFVFAPRSRRYITREWASVLRARLNGCIGVVGVFYDAGLDEIADLVKDGIIDMVQLHGNEDAAYVKSLRELLSGTACAPIIKAVSADFLHSHIPSGGCCSHDCIPSGGFGGPDYFLIDNGGGGTGRAFDWGILHGLHRDDKLYLDLGCAPFFLAGGIDEDNIAEALAVAPYAVDVSSGAETNGVKDA
ncbi:MAG: phosphoribosylanthranilate isomerase, partial [Oscillospiraceae bacterium]|nr:phosphoribosylanthranilate isomerase [Oscillospiraceae bacterium]